MTEPSQADLPKIYVVDLWGQAESECGICEEWGRTVTRSAGIAAL